MGLGRWNVHIYYGKNLTAGEIITVDINNNHINRCRYMTSEFNNITYIVSPSEDFLNKFNIKIDLLYMDTGDMTPIQDTAALALREAKIIVEKDVVSKDGLILIDDVRSTVPHQFHPELITQRNFLGKAMYSMPYFLDHGFRKVMDEYQVVLSRN
jgi:hypothetical protein